jgi:predicted phage terminase large subunit-like protein
VAAPSRDRLVSEILKLEDLTDERLRHEILQNDRIDLLMTEVLGYGCFWHHRQLLRHQLRNPRRSLALVWRGAGKTTARTVAYGIFKILKNPDIRILIASRSGENASMMAIEMRNHFEKNEKFRRVFGDWVGADNWSDTEFTVKPRRSPKREPTVCTVGVEGAVVSRHFDVVLGDDLVEEKTARTPKTREILRTFYWKSLFPCLEPNGEIHLSGTPYHYADLYAELREGDFKGDATLVIPLLGQTEDGQWYSNWPEYFKLEAQLEARTNMGLLMFNTQYQCNCDLMQGKIFDYDTLVEMDVKEWPRNLEYFGGSDLAISLKKDSDYFATAVIGYHRETDVVYVLSVFRKRGMPVHLQQKRVIEDYDAFRCVRWVTEANFYQESLAQEVKRLRPDIRIFGHDNKTDKETRAHALVARIDSKKFVLAKGLNDLIQEMCQFPDGDHDDMIDAVHAAIRAATGKAKKKRPEYDLNWREVPR